MCLLSFHDQAHGNPLELLPQNGNISSTFHSFPINNAACLLRYMGYHVICKSLLRNIFQVHKYNTECFFCHSDLFMPDMSCYFFVFQFQNASLRRYILLCVGNVHPIDQMNIRIIYSALYFLNWSNYFFLLEIK